MRAASTWLVLPDMAASSRLDALDWSPSTHGGQEPGQNTPAQRGFVYRAKPGWSEEETSQREAPGSQIRDRLWRSKAGRPARDPRRTSGGTDGAEELR